MTPCAALSSSTRALRGKKKLIDRDRIVGGFCARIYTDIMQNNHYKYSIFELLRRNCECGQPRDGG
jgi:hypothetical protein